MLAAVLLGPSVSSGVEPALRAVPVFTAAGGSAEWRDVLAAMDQADIVLVGESHTDSRGHELQTQLIEAVGGRWDTLVLSLEEFDRSQQAALDDYAVGELTDAELKAARDFVDPRIKKNWESWFLPKIKAARAAGATLIASNAPLKYSRMVRNLGCDDLPPLTAAERALFDCPTEPLDVEYQDRFVQRLQRVARGNKRTNLKQLDTEQAEILFRAQRVWDATMAVSIARARAATSARVLHTVGSFHCDFRGGLVDELRARDPDARILVITFTPKRGPAMQEADRGRADFVVYTRG